MKTVDVVAAIIINDKDEVYICQRSENMTLPNYWEFPGGKLKPFETPKDTLHREILEELNCEVDIKEQHCKTFYQYGSFNINLITYICSLKDKMPVIHEHQDEKWVSIDQLDKNDFPPADEEAIIKLQSKSQKRI